MQVKSMKPQLKFVILISTAFICSLNISVVRAQTRENTTPDMQYRAGLSEHFRYTGDGSVFISGHRGGREEGYPENSLEGFQNVLTHAPAFFEVDPRLTKDSIIVLMHDATLDRTTTGVGFLRDLTRDQLKSVRLKDSKGNITPYSVPTLEEVIIWCKAKTIINLDKKDVPMEMIVDLIRRLHAEDYVMVTVHSGAQARYYYDRIPDIMLSAFSRTMEEYEDLATSGVPWHNMIAYVGQTINPGNKRIVDSLHANGVRCMISLAPTADKLNSSFERQQAYLEEIKKQPDIIESDFPVEIWKVLQLR